LKKSTTGILLSLLLSLSVIFCLIYLLKIISTQKELAEIKNDLINSYFSISAKKITSNG